MSVDPTMLEAVVRDHLNTAAPRTMAVLDPLKVTIINSMSLSPVSVPDFPVEPEKGSHTVQLNRVLYIGLCRFWI